MANRHGLVAGATGTGKTVTLQVLAEAFSARGVPVLVADVKGDLSGISQPGREHPRISERIASLGVEGFAWAGCPVTFWDVFGEQGHPVRVALSELGPVLLARLLQLNETQSGVLHLAFRVADDHGMLLLDLKDLRALLAHLGQNASAFATTYGQVSAASVGAIQRALLSLESEGGDRFFGEPSLNLDDLLQTDARGRGVVNILAADRLIRSPKVYATLLLWMLSELFENLPEVGDPPCPRLVFFFDEAHLLFQDLPRVLQEKVEQVVRLIRSKGVGVYFVTQRPQDLPDTVLSQLGNRVQHALRAFTPRDQKAVRAAAETFRVNPALDTEAVLTSLGVGEALVSLLDDRGQPGMVQRTLIVPPRSRIGPITVEERAALIRESLVAGVYEQAVDRESAYEQLARARGGVEGEPAGGRAGGSVKTPVPLPSAAPRPAARGRTPDSLMETMAKSAARSLGSGISRQIVRGLLGSIFGGRRR
jgi:DNA helicase HerA-like ATPase